MRISALPTCLLLALFMGSRPIELSIGHGTLVVFVPTQSGFVVASDSRSEYKTRKQLLKCDNATKIFPLKKHDRSIIAITGNSAINKPGSGVEKNCEEFKPNVVFGEVVRDYLDSQPGVITQTKFESSHKSILNLFSRVRGTIFVPQLTDDFLTVAFGEYQSDRSTIVFAYFKMGMRDGHVTGISTSEWEEVQQNQAITVKMQGAASCLVEATQIAGRQEVGPGYLKDYDAMIADGLVIKDVTHGRALAIAVDILKTTQKYGEVTGCQSDSVGGPTQAFLVDSAHAHPYRLLPLERKN
jgi:hypothetical protein